MSYFPIATTRDQDENQWWLDRELSLIENALREEGEMPRRELSEKLGCKYWGPRRGDQVERERAGRLAGDEHEREPQHAERADDPRGGGDDGGAEQAAEPLA